MKFIKAPILSTHDQIIDFSKDKLHRSALRLDSVTIDTVVIYINIRNKSNGVCRERTYKNEHLFNERLEEINVLECLRCNVTCSCGTEIDNQFS